MVRGMLVAIAVVLMAVIASVQCEKEDDDRLEMVDDVFPPSEVRADNRYQRVYDLLSRSNARHYSNRQPFEESELPEDVEIPRPQRRFLMHSWACVFCRAAIANNY
ncbi:uncharacterized protein LOC134795989 [Cydia splendana]|uniref:uncharacterized protein LOC134795989 n=1 Tax=Cydia splendana TaxID=1100963 RepID=UPI0028F4AF9C